MVVIKVNEVLISIIEIKTGCLICNEAHKFIQKVKNVKSEENTKQKSLFCDISHPEVTITTDFSKIEYLRNDLDFDRVNIAKIAKS